MAASRFACAFSAVIVLLPDGAAKFAIPFCAAASSSRVNSSGLRPKRPVKYSRVNFAPISRIFLPRSACTFRSSGSSYSARGAKTPGPALTWAYSQAISFQASVTMALSASARSSATLLCASVAARLFLPSVSMVSVCPMRTLLMARSCLARKSSCNAPCVCPALSSLTFAP